MDELRQDLRFALRTLAKSPGFTLVVVLTLGLGIGANTAIFTLMDQVLLRMLPVREPERLVVLDGPGPYSGMSHSSIRITPISHPMLLGLNEQATSVLEGVLGHCPTAIHLTIGRDTEEVTGDLVTGTFFPLLGLTPAAGRLLGPEDDQTPGGHPVIVISHGYWTRRFGGDPSVVGRSVLVNSHPMTIVGVAPAGFNGVDVGSADDVFVPAHMQPQIVPTWPRGVRDWRARWLIAMARLKDGVSLEQASAGVNVVYAGLLQEDLKTIEGVRSESFRTRFLQKKLELIPGGRGTSGLREQSQKPLLMLMGMVALVLLIVCANVANLLLARASARQREIAIRLALGASRARLMRQLLVESVVLSLAGGFVGMLFAVWTSGLLVRALPYEEARRVLSTDPDLRVGLFALALSVLTGIAFGLAPALQSTRPNVGPTLKNEAGSVIGGGHFRFRKGLVVAQVALSLLLLVGAGLFTRSLMNLRTLDPGFRPEQLLAFGVNPALNAYDVPRRVATVDRIRDEIAAEPGVSSVSMAEVALMTDSNWSSTVRVEGYEPKEQEDMNPGMNGVGPGFFATLGIPLLSGRDFTDADVEGAPKVAVVNETFARYFFKGQDPVGRRFGMGRNSDKIDITIVGMVKDGKAANLRDEYQRFVYFPIAQSTDVGGVTFYTRTALDPSALGSRLRAAVQRVDSTLPVSEMKTMSAQVGESLFVERMVAALSAAFGLLATLLAAVGLYGVMSYAVTLRTREIGIRVALGADRGRVLGMVLKEVAILAALGVVVGLPGGYGLGRLVETQLFGLNARDPLTFAVATVTLLASAFLAGYVPAVRAARVQPMVALRYE